MKNISTLQEISEYAELGGYDKRDIHIVWVCVDSKIAKERNKQRSRSVSDEILINTHLGASKTMKELIKESETYQKYIDGDVWIVFNMSGVDNKFVLGGKNKFGKNSMYLKEYTALHIKERGKPARSLNSIDEELKKKIQNYVPDSSDWM